MLRHLPTLAASPSTLRWRTVYMVVAHCGILSAGFSLAASAADTEAVADAAPCVNCDRPNDRVWFISTRHLGCRTDIPASGVDLEVQRYHPQHGWQISSVAEFLASQTPDVRLQFHIHGARVRDDESIQRGWKFYYEVTCRDPDRTTPMNYVIWSWPASPAGHPARDLRAMAARSEYDAIYVAWLVAQVDPATRLEFSGFSYGARITCGALHLLAGGSLHDVRVVDPEVASRRSARVVLWAPAFHCDWLYPGHYFGRSLECVDQMLIVYNSCDRALRRYRMVDPCRQAQALGYTGLGYATTLEPYWTRIRQLDACCLVGREHSYAHHLECPTITAASAATLATTESEPESEALPADDSTAADGQSTAPSPSSALTASRRRIIFARLGFLRQRRS